MLGEIFAGVKVDIQHLDEMTLKLISLPLCQAVRSYQECLCAPVSCSSA